MKVGRMRYRIRIQEYTITTDLDGFSTEGWTTIYTVWADITPVSGKEYLSSGQITSEITSKIYIRAIHGLKTNMRITSGERCFNIESILTDERTGMMTILTKEIE